MTVSAGNSKSKNLFTGLQAQSDKIYLYLTVAWIFVCAFFYLKLSLNPVCDYDESYTVSMVSHSFREIISITSQDVHSPMYYFLVKALSLLPGINVILASKLFSYLCAILFLCITAVFVVKRYGSKTAYNFVILASANPMMISQVCNARMYTAGLLFFSVAVCSGYLISEKYSHKRAVIFIITSIVTVYLHHVFMTMMVLTYLIFICISLFKMNFKHLKVYFFCGLATGLSFLPWFFVMIGQFRNRNESGSVLYSLSDTAMYRDYFYAWKDELFSGTFYSYGWMIRFWMAAIILVIPGFVFFFRKNKKDFLPLLGPVIMILTFMIPGILLVMYSGQFFARYAFPGYAGIWLFMAVSLSGYENGKRVISTAFNLFKVLILAAALFFGIKTYEAQLEGLDRSGIDAYRQIMAEVSEGDAVMFSDTWSSLLQIYDEDKDYWIYGYNPEGMPYNYTGVYTSREQLAPYERVWLVGNDTIEIANLEPDYTLKNRLEFDHHSYHFIVKIYEKS